MVYIILPAVAVLLPAAFVLVLYFIFTLKSTDDREVRAQRRWRLINRGNALWLASVIGGLIAIGETMPPYIPAFVTLIVSWIFILVSVGPFMLMLGIADRRIRGIDYPLSGYLKFQYIFFFTRWSSFLVVVALFYCPLRLVEVDGSIAYRGVALALAGAALFVLVTLFQMRLIGRATGMLTIPSSSEEPTRMIGALAERAGVPDVRVFVMETFGYPFYNAFAAPGRLIYVTRPLLDALEKKQVEAVAAHEIGHLKTMKKRTILILLPLTLCVVIAWFVIPQIAGILSDIGSFIVEIMFFLILFLVAIFSINMVSRRFETQADKTASDLMGGTELIASALERIYALNMIPRRFDKKGSENASHPSLERRLAELKGEPLPKPVGRKRRVVILSLCIVVVVILIFLMEALQRRERVIEYGGFQSSWSGTMAIPDEEITP